MDSNSHTTELDRIEALFGINNDESVMQALSMLADMTNAEKIQWKDGYGCKQDDKVWSCNVYEISEHGLVPHIAAQLLKANDDMQHRKEVVLALKILTSMGVFGVTQYVEDGIPVLVVIFACI